MRTKRKRIVCFLSLALVLGTIPATSVSAAKKISLNNKKITITKCRSKTIKVKNTKKKVKWKILSGKKYITLKKKGKTTATIKGRQKGKAKVQAKIGKKKLACTVTVKNFAKPSNAPSGADVNDVAALKTLILEQLEQGATVSSNMSNKSQYTWENGRLTELSWFDKHLSGKLDTSNLSALEELDCFAIDGGNLTSLNVSKNVNLTNLNCGYQKLKELNVSNNIKLRWLQCQGNPLKTLDVSANTELELLSCAQSKLSKLDVSNNIKLETLRCDVCKLSNLDVSKCKELSTLSCCRNQIKTLDLTNNKKLEDLACDATVTVTGYNKKRRSRPA